MMSKPKPEQNEAGLPVASVSLPRSEAEWTRDSPLSGTGVPIGIACQDDRLPTQRRRERQEVRIRVPAGCLAPVDGFVHVEGVPEEDGGNHEVRTLTRQSAC